MGNANEIANLDFLCTFVSMTTLHNVSLMYYLCITDTPNYSSGYSEQAKNFVSIQEVEQAISRSILGLEKVSRSQNDEKVIAIFWLFIIFCSSLNRLSSI